MRRPLLALPVVLALLGGGLAAASAASGDPVASGTGPARAPRATSVAAAALSCPAPAVTGRTSSVVTAVAPSTRRVAARGQLFERQLLGRNRLQGDALTEGGRRSLVTARGELLHVVVPTKTGPVVARATGALAPGLAAGQFSRAEAGPARGIGLAECAAASTGSWFVGGGAGVGRTTTLYLTNPDSTPAQVDVRVWGPQGELTSRALVGIAVGPGGQRTVRLDAEVPAERYGISVRATSGRIAAALREQQDEGLQQLGWDWVAAAAVPSRTLVVPGLIGGSGRRTLRILAPGDSGAVVHVSVVGTSGTTSSDALSAVAVDAGTVAEVDVSDAAGRSPAGLVLESDVPVTASLLVRQGALAGSGTEPADFAYLSAGTPTAAGQSSVLPYVATGVGRFAELELSAPRDAATVRLVPLARPGRPAPPAREVRVAGGTTLQVPLDTGVGTYAYAVLVQVVRGSGPVWAAGVLREAGERGPLLTALGLHPQPELVRVPAVTADPALAQSSPASP